MPVKHIIIFSVAPADLMETEQKPHGEEALVLQAIVPAPGWDALFHELMDYRGKAMIIGATDSGKSTLARYLLERLLAAEVKACIVDSDVGQSSLGLPGTVSMKLFLNEQGREDFRYEKMSFIGTVNPAKNIASVINAAKRMSGICGTMADVTLHDTSGLISGDIGLSLKSAKSMLSNPGKLLPYKGMMNWNISLKALTA